MLEIESKVCPTFFWRAFDMRGRLVGQNEVKLAEHELNFFLGLSVSGQDQLATIRGGQMDVDHLDGFELFKDGPGCQPRGFRLGSLLEGDLQAVGQEAHENMRLDPVVFLVVDWTQAQVVFDFLERLFDFGEHDVLFPQVFWIAGGQIGAKQIGSFSAPGLA